MIYWLIFFISTLLMYIAQREKGIIKKMTFFGSLFVLILLASLRSYEVGRDVSTYLRPLFYVAKNSSNVINFFSACNKSLGLKDIEFGFRVLVYYSTKFFNNIQMVFFVIEILILIPTFFALYIFSGLMKEKEIYYSLSMSVLTFCGLFYCYFLSATRQGIACSFVLLGVVYWISGHKYKSIVFMVLSFFMHKSGVVGFALIMIYVLYNKKLFRKKSIYIVVGLIFAIFYNYIFPIIMLILQKMGLMSNKYIGWQNNSYYSSDMSGGVNVASLACTCLMLCICYFVLKRKNNNIIGYLFVVSFLSLCMTPFVARYPTFGRVNVYFQELALLVYPISSEAFFMVKRNERRGFAFFVNICFLLLYWIVTVVISATTDTANYSFFWQ